MFEHIINKCDLIQEKLMTMRTLITDVAIAAMVPDQGPYGLIQDGAIAIDDGVIQWVGPRTECPPQFATLKHTSFDGRLVTPTLIDCHTHVVHGGNRAHEFELRLNGASYEEVARAGGGIVSTVTATRAATEADLLADALVRVDALIAEGVSTVEIKSGYGLDTDTELKMLRVAREIGRQRPITVLTSYLGAHTIPAGMDADAYLDDVCIPTLVQAHALGLVDAVDGFCESIAFTPAQIERVFQKAQALGLPVKLHAEQLNNLGGTALAARFGALSADHVEYANEGDAKLMAASGTVAVLLPGAFYALRETQVPPVDAFRAHKVPMAVGTDWNPGTSPLGSLLLAMNMACTLFRLTPEEALAGATHHAAQALGLTDRGMIGAGLRADLAIWDVTDPAELSYRIGANPLHARIYGGVQ
jgi:imidazolonepropionase